MTGFGVLGVLQFADDIHANSDSELENGYHPDLAPVPQKSLCHCRPLRWNPMATAEIICWRWLWLCVRWVQEVLVARCADMCNSVHKRRKKQMVSLKTNRCWMVWQTSFRTRGLKLKGDPYHDDGKRLLKGDLQFKGKVSSNRASANAEINEKKNKMVAANSGKA